MNSEQRRRLGALEQAAARWRDGVVSRADYLRAKPIDQMTDQECVEHIWWSCRAPGPPLPPPSDPDEEAPIIAEWRRLRAAEGEP